MSVTPVQCPCGSVSGSIDDLSPRSNNYVVCYCDDCQAYARYLGTNARVLDGSGGSRIVQIRPRQISLRTGHDALRCLRLKPGGLLRWYAACCQMPIANTVKASLPFVGVVAPFVRPADAAHVFGDADFHIQAEHATGPTPASAAPAFPKRLLARIARQLLVAKLRGHHRPSPFFDANGLPVTNPETVN